MSHDIANRGEILLYSDENGREFVNVIFKDETFWLTQKAMSELFDCTTDNISREQTRNFLAEHADVDRTVVVVCQIEHGEQEFVFCVQDGHAVQCVVQTGYLLEDTVEIIDGLPTGVSVILSPPDELTDGDLVEVQT